MRHSIQARQSKAEILGKTIAENIRVMREQRQWDVEDLVFYSGLSDRTITNLETGVENNPTIKTLLCLAMAFEIDIGKLLDVSPCEA